MVAPRRAGGSRDGSLVAETVVPANTRAGVRLLGDEVSFGVGLRC
jgi:hypothetical protein